MRHRVAGYRLGRTKDQRIGLRRTLINQLFTYERIETTRAKAMAIRGDAERLITLDRHSPKKTDLEKETARRLAAARTGNADSVQTRLGDITPRVAHRAGS